MLVLGLKECMVECATLCVKSEVMLTSEVNLGFNWAYIFAQKSDLEKCFLIPFDFQTGQSDFQSQFLMSKIT